MNNHIYCCSTWTHHIVTSVKYSDPISSSSLSLKDTLSSLAKSVESALNSALIVNNKLLREEHEEVWRKVGGLNVFQTL